MSTRSQSTGDQKFFSTTKRGEISEWREQLNSEKEYTRKEAVKRVIAAMTVGKDVSMLFSDVIKSIQTGNIELKKLVYLYVMNYAKSKPDLAIMAVNTFVKDSTHSNPLVRALAVRTMGCIRVDRIVEYLSEPLRRTLKDKDPYVRKTAAVAVAKLFDLNPQLTIDQGFIEALEELLTDQNPMVVANAVAALSEIAANSNEVVLDFTEKTVNTLLAALNECTEWGQIFILDAMAGYEPKGEKEATTIAERIVPRLAHANSAVVLSAVKVIMQMLKKISNQEVARNLLKKLAAPLVTLLNSKPEIQYVALRNINLIVQKRPGILAKDIKVFFCKYNDPIYVKLEKLEIMIKLASERNIDTVLMEFKEYASEVDVEFVRKSVRAIGRCAIKLERAAQRCIDVLLELIQTKVNYVVQEAIIVIKDIFRKYPNRYETIIGTLCENLETLDEPEAKASMIWIIGEYAERIENADELLEIFTDTFHDESPQVQLQFLTASVKLFLKRPSVGEKLVTEVLNLCTKESDNPDLRDRAYMYWRLLSTNPTTTKQVVLAEKPTIRDDSTSLSPQLLDELLGHIATLASIYHKPPELFVADYKKKKPIRKEVLDEPKEEEQVQEKKPTTTTIGNLLDIGEEPTDIIPGTEDVSFDAFLGSPSLPAVQKVVQKRLLLTAERGKGLQIYGIVDRKDGRIVYDMRFENTTNQPIGGFAMKFNHNTFSLAPAGPITVGTLAPGQFGDCIVPLSRSGRQSDKISNILQVAVKTNYGVVYFQDQIPFAVFFTEDGRLTTHAFTSTWKSIPDDAEQVVDLPNVTSSNIETVKQKLELWNIFLISKYPLESQENYYFSAQMEHQGYTITFVAEFAVSTHGTKLSIKSASPEFIPMFEKEITRIISQ